MDAEYICNHLIKLLEAMTGEKGNCYAFKTRTGQYVFGYPKEDIHNTQSPTRNKVSTPIAIYLSIGK